MLLKLFLTFFEIGAVSFGGGYGMISLIREKVLLHGWAQEERIQERPRSAIQSFPFYYDYIIT